MAVLLATSNGSSQTLLTTMTRQLRCVNRVMCKGEERRVKYKGILLNRERGREGEKERKGGGGREEKKEEGRGIGEETE